MTPVRTFLLSTRLREKVIFKHVPQGFMLVWGSFQVKDRFVWGSLVMQRNGFENVGFFLFCFMALVSSFSRGCGVKLMFFWGGWGWCCGMGGEGFHV
jgi:hypothetical protein